MSKKIVIFMLALSMCFSLTACKDDSSNKQTEQTSFNTLDISNNNDAEQTSNNEDDDSDSNDIENNE